jgi:hypothetical protein
MAILRVTRTAVRHLALDDGLLAQIKAIDKGILSHRWDVEQLVSEWLEIDAALSRAETHDERRERQVREAEYTAYEELLDNSEVEKTAAEQLDEATVEKTAAEQLHEATVEKTAAEQLHEATVETRAVGDNKTDEKHEPPQTMNL